MVSYCLLLPKAFDKFRDDGITSMSGQITPGVTDLSDEKVTTGKRERERKEGKRKRKRTPVRKPLHDPRIRKTLLYRERIN